MKTKVLWALVALNVLLLVGLIAPLGSSPAHAQNGGQKQARAGDHFLMISGEVVGGNSAIVYIVDETQNLLTARTLVSNNPRNGTLEDMPAPIDLDRVFLQAAGGGGAGGAAGVRP